MLNLYFKLNKEEVEDMISDIVRLLTIYIIFHLLSYSIDDQGELFDEKTLKYSIYIVIATIIYHIIIKRVISQNIFKKKSSKQKQR